MGSPIPDAPPPGTRPSNRRDVTVRAAVELFARRGYSQVAMSDIADATNVGASALYRHFPSKVDLLVAAIRSGLDPWARAIAGSAGTSNDASLDDVLHRLATTAIDHRRVGVLWQREVRHVPPEPQRQLRQELRDVARLLADAARSTHPALDTQQADALAWCALGALVSIGFHSLDLPRPQFDDLLLDIMWRVLSTPIPGLEAEPQSPLEQHSTVSRRDELLSVATELFAENGFAATGIDEIGDAAGIAGPSVYNHFESKQAILAAAIKRASEAAADDVERVLASDDSPEGKLVALVDAYVQRALSDRFVLRVVLSEMDQLAPDDRERARVAQDRFVEEWTRLLLESRSEDPVAARIRVRAVLLMVNDAVQTPHLRAQSGFAKLLVRVSQSVIKLGEPTVE